MSAERRDGQLWLHSGLIFSNFRCQSAQRTLKYALRSLFHFETNFHAAADLQILVNQPYAFIATVHFTTCVSDSALRHCRNTSWSDAETSGADCQSLQAERTGSVDFTTGIDLICCGCGKSQHGFAARKCGRRSMIVRGQTPANNLDETPQLPMHAG